VQNVYNCMENIAQPRYASSAKPNPHVLPPHWVRQAKQKEAESLEPVTLALALPNYDLWKQARRARLNRCRPHA
jgi:hypothetical protein